MAMERVGIAVADRVRVCDVTMCRISLVLVLVVLAVMRCWAGFLPAVGADRRHAELQRHADQEKDR